MTWNPSSGLEPQDLGFAPESEIPPGGDVCEGASQSWGLAPWLRHSAGIFLSGPEPQDLGHPRASETWFWESADDPSPHAWRLAPWLVRQRGGPAPWPAHLTSGLLFEAESQELGYALVSKSESRQPSRGTTS